MSPQTCREAMPYNRTTTLHLFCCSKPAAPWKCCLQSCPWKVNQAELLGAGTHGEPTAPDRLRAIGHQGRVWQDCCCSAVISLPLICSHLLWRAVLLTTPWQPHPSKASGPINKLGYLVFLQQVSAKEEKHLGPWHRQCKPWGGEGEEELPPSLKAPALGGTLAAPEMGEGGVEQGEH